MKTPVFTKQEVSQLYILVGTLDDDDRVYWNDVLQGYPK